MVGKNELPSTSLVLRLPKFRAEGTTARAGFGLDAWVFGHETISMRLLMQAGHTTDRLPDDIESGARRADRDMRYLCPRGDQVRVCMAF